MTRGDILRMAIRNKNNVVDEVPVGVRRMGARIHHPQLGREINLKFTFINIFSTNGRILSTKNISCNA